MRSIVLFQILMFLFTISGYSQDNFKVIKVNGSIVLKGNGTSLETGTIFSEKEDLMFRSENATAAVINSRRGRLILTSRNHDLSSASSNFLPAMYNIASRGGSLINLIDLEKHFSGKYVVLDKQDILLNSQNFPMNNDHFFFLRYTYKGENINKKLEFSGDTLILDKRTLYTIDGNPIPNPDNTTIMLFYRKGAESIRINQFDLIFPDTKQLKKEIQIILDEFKDKPAKEKIAEINGYISENYGIVYQENLLWWLKTNFGLKTE